MKNLFPPFEDPPNDIWTKTFEGVGRYCQQTIDNGYIIIGHISAPGPFNSDILLIKTDIDGNELWNKTYGGPYEDIGHIVRETSDGGFILEGYYSHAQGGPYDVVLIKTDENGNLTWEKRFNRGPEQTTFGDSVIELDDGYLILSKIYIDVLPFPTDIWLIKTDFDGNELWNKTVGESNGRDFCNEIIQTSEGDFLIVGHVGWEYVLLIKTDKDGNRLWRKELDGWEGFDIKECDDGGYIIAGREHVCLIKTSKGGHVQWKKEYGWGGFDKALSVDVASDGGFILSGIGTYSSADILLIKTDEKGNREWEKTMGGENSDSGNCIIQSNDGTYVIIGATLEPGFWLIKVAPFENHRPNKPARPGGPAHCKPLRNYTFTASTSDPDGEQVYYTWTMDDVIYYNFYNIGPYSNDEPCDVEMSWLLGGQSEIKVKAIDIYRGESDWSDPLIVTISWNRIMTNPLLLRFLERYPLLQKLLLLMK